MMNKVDEATVDDLYADVEHWQLNLGEETIHAKRQPGKWRKLRWFGSATWLVFFLGPYLRWGDRQAVLWDIPNRQLWSNCYSAGETQAA